MIDWVGIGIPLALFQCMSDIIRTIYEVRLLQQKQESAEGLSMDEVVDLEKHLAEMQGERFGREFRRLDLKISALIRFPGKDTLVEVMDLSPGGMRLSGCPHLDTGTDIEMHLRESEDRSYRFPAKIIWMRDQGDQHITGVRFTGNPIEINHGPSGDGPENIVDQINIKRVG